MLEIGDTLIVGVSGGADSVCLLLILQELSKQYQLKLIVLHVHHMIRAAEADEDAIFVQNLCQTYQIPCFIEHVPVEQLAKKYALSLEEAGRNERYRLFREYQERHQAQKIAVAHHQDDNIETVLFQMLRGTGLKGLAGMESVREDGIIRPLLCCNREEIECWLLAQNQPWRVDFTNLTREYGRNKIRLDILPAIKQAFGEGAVQQLTSQCEIYREMDDYFSSKANEFLEQYWMENMKFPRNNFLNEPKPIQRYICLECLSRVCQSRRDLGHVHVEELLELIQKNTVSQKNFPYGITVRNQYGMIYFEREQDNFINETSFQYEIEMKIKVQEELKNFQENSCKKCFDYDKIKGAVILRTRQSGDWMQLYANGGKKKLKDILIDLKIPKQERDAIPLVAVGNEILWIYGHRSSQAYRVGKDTRTILEITIRKKKGTEDGREN